MNKSLCTPLIPQKLPNINSSKTLPAQNTRYHTRRTNEEKQNKTYAQPINQNLCSLAVRRLQPKRVLRRLPVPSNPLSAREVLVLHILLVALPLVRVLGDVLHAFGGFAVRAADGASDVADGGFEGFFEDLAYWIADDAEETLSRHCG